MLPYISKNQPQVCARPLPVAPPSHLPPRPTPELSRGPTLSSPSPTESPPGCQLHAYGCVSMLPRPPCPEVCSPSQCPHFFSSEDCLGPCLTWPGPHPQARVQSEPRRRLRPHPPPGKGPPWTQTSGAIPSPRQAVPSLLSITAWPVFGRIARDSENCQLWGQRSSIWDLLAASALSTWASAASRAGGRGRSLTQASLR